MPQKPLLSLDPPKRMNISVRPLDSRFPYTINHLIVGDLGIEEILLIATDYGEVVAYRTRDIMSAIERRSDPGVLNIDDGDEVRPLWHDNLGDTAWGLAIHSRARMIAASSNSHEVTVFAFGLAGDLPLARKEPSRRPETTRKQTQRLQIPGHPLDDSATSRSMSPDDFMEQRHYEDYITSRWPQSITVRPPEESSSDYQDFPYPRQRDHRIVLPRTEGNIPCIAFCNTGHDPEGRWLLSGGIKGVVYVWDVHHRSILKIIKGGFCDANSRTGSGACGCDPQFSGYFHGSKYFSHSKRL